MIFSLQPSPRPNPLPQYVRTSLRSATERSSAKLAAADWLHKLSNRFHCYIDEKHRRSVPIVIS